MRNALETIYKLNDLPHVFANIPLIVQEILLVKEVSGGLKLLLRSGVIVYIDYDELGQPRDVHFDHASQCVCEG